MTYALQLRRPSGRRDFTSEQIVQLHAMVDEAWRISSEIDAKIDQLASEARDVAINRARIASEVQALRAQAARGDELYLQIEEFWMWLGDDDPKVDNAIQNLPNNSEAVLDEILEIVEM